MKNEVKIAFAHAWLSAFLNTYFDEGTMPDDLGTRVLPVSQYGKNSEAGVHVKLHGAPSIEEVRGAVEDVLERVVTDGHKMLIIYI